jgi:hypothetical protein
MPNRMEQTSTFNTLLVEGDVYYRQTDPGSGATAYR